MSAESSLLPDDESEPTTSITSTIEGSDAAMLPVSAAVRLRMTQTAREKAHELRQWASEVGLEVAEEMVVDAKAQGDEVYRSQAEKRLEDAKQGEFKWSEFSHTELARGISRRGGGGTSVRIYFQFVSNLCGFMYVLSIISAPSIVFNSWGNGLSGSWNISAVVINPLANMTDLSQWGVNVWQRARLQSTILNVCQGAHCVAQADIGLGTTMWSILLVSTVLGLLVTITMTKIQMEAYRAQIEIDRGVQLERCAIRLRNVPEGASEEQVRRWLDTLTGRGNGNAIHHIFVPLPSVTELEGVWLGEAYVYYNSPVDRERAIASIPLRWNFWEGFQSLSHFRWAWQVRQGEWGDKMVILEEHAPMPWDIQWANLTISKKCRFAWYSGFLALWALVLACEVGLFYAYLLACSQARRNLSGGVALFLQIAVFNPIVCFAIVLVDMLTYVLAWLEAPILTTEYTRAVLWQSYVVNTFLMLLMLLACFPDIFPWKNVMSNVTVPQTVMYVVNFVFTNTFTNQISTYLNLGPRISAPLWDKVMWPLWFNQCVRRCWGCCKCCGAHSYVMKQKHADATWAPPEFEFSGRYVGILYIVTVGLFASPGIPIAIPLTALALTVQYYADMHWLMEYCALPKHVGFSEVLSVPRLALSIASTLCLSLVWIAYLWWTRCADRLTTYAELEQQDMNVMPWRIGDMGWASYGYYAIGPFVCFLLWLLYCCGSPVFTRLARNFYKKKYSPWDMLEVFQPGESPADLDLRGDYHEIWEEIDSPGLQPAPFGPRESSFGDFDEGEAIGLAEAAGDSIGGNLPVQFGEPFYFAFEDAFAEWEASQVVDATGTTPATSRTAGQPGDQF